MSRKGSSKLIPTFTPKQKLYALGASYLLVGGAVYLALRNQERTDSAALPAGQGSLLPSPGPLTIFWWLPHLF